MQALDEVGAAQLIFPFVNGWIDACQMPGDFSDACAATVVGDELAPALPADQDGDVRSWPRS